MESSTLQAKPLPPCTCNMTSSSTQVVQCRRERTILRGNFSRICLCQTMRLIIKEICLSETSGIEGWAVLMKCMSWTLTPYTTITSFRRSASRSLPLAAPPLLYFPHICGRYILHGGVGYAETHIQPPCNEVEASLLYNGWLRKY